MSFPSSIRRRDSNPRPLEHESTPITTRPGLPLNCLDFVIYRRQIIEFSPFCSQNLPLNFDLYLSEENEQTDGATFWASF